MFNVVTRRMPSDVHAGRAFIREPRCIYTGQKLDNNHPKFKPSYEHIIPLSLGGADDFTTHEVCYDANTRAANDIDDAVASLLPFLMLRRKCKLRGNRRGIPNAKLRGEFPEINAKARLDIDVDGKITFQFNNETQTSGNVITLASTEDRVRFLLKGRLEQAKRRQRPLPTPLGTISDEEDIEVALELAERREAGNLKGNIILNPKEYDLARFRLILKIALGLGHRVLGPEWTFGPGGHLLRQGLFFDLEGQ